MRVMIVTDAWEPQVNGVVRTLKSTRRELEAMGHTVDLLTPLEFRTVPCPTYPEIRLSILPSAKVRRRIDTFRPDALHIATEGPLGMSARAYAIKHKLPFTTAYHTRFPEYVQARFGVPLAWACCCSCGTAPSGKARSLCWGMAGWAGLWQTGWRRWAAG